MTSGSLGKSSLFTFVGLAFQGASRALTNIAIGRVGGVSSLGLAATGTAAGQLAALLYPTSAGAGASRFIPAAGDAEAQARIYRYLEKRCAQAGVALALATGALFFFGYQWSPSASATVVLLVLGFSAYAFMRGVLYGYSAVKSAVLTDIYCATLAMCGVLMLLIIGTRGVELLLPLAFANIVYAAWGRPRLRLKGATKPANSHEIDMFVVLGIVGTLTSAGFLQVSMLVAERTGSTHGAGIYSAALTLATPASIAASAFGMVLFPELARVSASADLNQIKSVTSAALESLSYWMIALFGTLIILSDMLIHIVWGLEFTDAGSVMKLLLLAVLANALGLTCSQTLTTRNQRGVITSTLIGILGALAGAGFWVVCDASRGPRWVAGGYLVGAVIIAILPMVIVWRKDRHKWAPLMLRCALGILVILVISDIDRRLASVWSLPLALVFLAMWFGIRKRDTKRILIMRLRRGRH